MSDPRVFVAECELCHTKFTEPTTECPVCGGTLIQAIRETVPAPKTIPKPALRKTPSPKAARRRAPAKPKAKPTPPPEPDYLYVPPRRLARPAAPHLTPHARPPARSDEIKARLTAAMAEYRESRRACAAALKRKDMAEASMHKLHAEFRRALEAERSAVCATTGRKGGGLGRFFKVVIGLL